jgi:hypothetical protein
VLNSWYNSSFLSLDIVPCKYKKNQLLKMGHGIHYVRKVEGQTTQWPKEKEKKNKK